MRTVAFESESIYFKRTITLQTFGIIRPACQYTIATGLGALECRITRHICRARGPLFHSEYLNRKNGFLRVVHSVSEINQSPGYSNPLMRTHPYFYKRATSGAPICGRALSCNMGHAAS